MKTENAKITSTFLGVEDHGIFTAYVTVEGHAFGCSFGGYAFDEPLRDGSGEFVKRRGCGFGSEFIKRLLEVLEVEKWESLTGTPVRIKIDGNGFGAIKDIGHFLKDQWLDVPSIVSEFKEAA